MSTTDTRAAFEAWMREEYDADDDMLKKPYEGRYFWPRAADAWSGWQASLSLSSSAAQESAPAELPPLPGCLADRLYEAIRIAYNRAQHAGSVPRMEKWEATIADLRAALSRPVVASDIDKVREAACDYLNCVNETPGVELHFNTAAAHTKYDRVRSALQKALAAAPASPQPVAKVLTETDIHAIIDSLPESAFEPTIAIGEITALFDDDNGEDGGVFDAIKSYAKIVAFRAIAASTPTTLTEKKE